VPQILFLLFSHQELALATFLDKEVLAFQENGIKKMMEY